MLKLIVFDWDDVFTTGSTAAYHACYVQAAKDSGANVEDARIREVVDELWGRPHETVIQEYLKDELELFEEVNRRYEEYVHTEIFLEQLSIVEGSLDMLIRLEKKYRLAIVSGINPDLLKNKVFPKFNVPNVFSEIITSYDLKDRSRGKPYPDMLNMVLESLNINPKHSILVGDSPADMKMAQAANVTPIAVLTGQLDALEAEELKVEHIMNTVAELELILPKFI